METIVYIDGFNLYHCAVKGTAYKWLDLPAFCDRLAGPGHTVVRVKYFTAKLKDLPHNPGSQQRQYIYWRALGALARLDVHLGKFQIQPKWRPLHKPGGPFKPEPTMAWVDLTEEKGSDVNLASWLLLDGFTGAYESAIVISNDSDLREPVRMVKEEIGLPVGVCNPAGGKKDQLTGSFKRPLREWMLRDSQLPTNMTDGEGAFHKPPIW